MLESVKTISTTQAIVNQLLSLIKEGSLKPGDRLPSENELVKVLGVARSSVREAKRVLIATNVIEVRAGRGSFVKKITPDDVIDVGVFHLLLADETALALQETRELLETQIAGLAAQRATAEDFKAMEEALEEMKRAAESNYSVYDAGMEFHLALTKASHNPVLIKLYHPVVSLLQEHQRPIYERNIDPEVEVQAHREIYESIRGGDAEKAEQMMYDHLQYVRNMTTEIPTQQSLRSRDQDTL